MSLTRVSGGLTAGMENTLIALLGKLGQPWTRELYNAFAPHFALTAIETVFLRGTPKGIEVLLHNRPDTDIPEWRGRPASPGSMLRATDRARQEAVYFDAFQRVAAEIGITSFQVTITPMDIQLHHTRRGTENALVFVCQMPENQFPKEGFWWHNVNTMPHGILDHHPEIIWSASNVLIESYRRLTTLSF